MANISIGGRTPKLNPAKMTLIEAFKPNAFKLTYTGIAYFAWPATVKGLPIELEWDQMAGDDYAAFRTMYATDVPIVFNPQDGSGRTFNVNMTQLTGDYLIGLGDTAESVRENVKMTLLIMSQV